MKPVNMSESARAGDERQAVRKAARHRSVPRRPMRRSERVAAHDLSATAVRALRLRSSARRALADIPLTGARDPRPGAKFRGLLDLVDVGGCARAAVIRAPGIMTDRRSKSGTGTGRGSCFCYRLLPVATCFHSARKIVQRCNRKGVC